MYVINGKGSMIRLLAGLFIVSSVLLGMYVNENFFFFTLFVGCMLLLSATTGFCPMEYILKGFKVKEKQAK